MKRLLAIAAVVLLLSVIMAAVAYFGIRGLLSGGDDDSPTTGQADGKSQPPADETTGRLVNHKRPPVEGLVLRPDRPKGEEIRVRDDQVAARNTYQVKPDDTLYDIALAHYGDASYVEDIRNANPGLTDNIRPGQKIRLPPKAREQPIHNQRTVTPKVYTVQRGDTLIRIARRYYGDSAMYATIFEMNRHQLRSPESIREGMVLQMPPQPQFDE